MSVLQSLPIFQAVAEEKSFSQAAKRLDLTQPTVSFHIDNLEKKLSCPLFLRTSKGVTLTIYGEILLECAKKTSALMIAAENELKTLLAGQTGQFKLGASTIPGEYILPEIVSAFLRHNPGIKLSLEISDSSSIITSFENGEFPLAIVGAKPTHNINYRELWRDEVVLVGHPTIWQELGGSLTLADLPTVSLITKDTLSGTRKSIFNSLEQKGVDVSTLNIILETSSNEALKTAILNQLGVGFISRWAVKKELTSGMLKTITIPEVNIERSFYLLQTSITQPTCVDLFLNHLNKSLS